MSKKARRSGSINFIIIVSLAIFVTLDLDAPRSGLINVSQQPLVKVIASMGK